MALWCVSMGYSLKNQKVAFALSIYCLGSHEDAQLRG